MAYEDNIQPTDQQGESEAHAAELSRMAWMMILGGGAFGPSTAPATSLGAAMFAPGAGGWERVTRPDGTSYYQPKTTQIDVTSAGYKNYQTIVGISKELDLPPDFLLKQEWYASRDLPAKDSEGFRQTIVDAVDYLKDKKPDVLKNHPELLHLQELAKQAIEKYKDPKDYLAALNDPNNHDLDPYRELINKPETSAYISGGYGLLRMSQGATAEEAGGELYLIRRLGEARAKEALSHDVKDKTAFLSDDAIKADPSLSDLQGLSAHDLVEMAKQKMDISVAPAVDSMKLDAASMNTLGGRQRMAMDILVSKYQAEGYSFDQAAIFAAGHVASFANESHFNDKEWGDLNKQGVYEAYGLGQWHADRRAHFREHFGYDMDKPPPDMPPEKVYANEVEWSYLEATDPRDPKNPERHDPTKPEGQEYIAGRHLRGATTAYDAGYRFSKFDERPGDIEGQATARGDLATKILADYKAGLAANPSPTVSNEPPPNGPVTYVNGFNPAAAQQYADTVKKPVSGDMCVDGTGRFLHAGGLPVPRIPNKWGEYNTFNGDWLLKHNYHLVKDRKIVACVIIHYPENKALGLKGHWEYVTPNGEVKSDFAQHDTGQHIALYPNAAYQHFVDSGQEPMEIYAPDIAPGPVAANTPQPPATNIAATTNTQQQPIRVADTSLSLGLGPRGMVQPAGMRGPAPPKPGDKFTVNLVGDSNAVGEYKYLETAFKRHGYDVHVANYGISGSGFVTDRVEGGRLYPGNSHLGLGDKVDEAIRNGGDIYLFTGHNDGPHAKEKVYAENDVTPYFDKLKKAMDSGRRVVVFSPVYLDNQVAGLKDVAALYKRLADERGIPFVDVNKAADGGDIHYEHRPDTHWVHMKESQTGYGHLGDVMVSSIVAPQPAPAPAPALPPTRGAQATPSIPAPTQIAAVAPPTPQVTPVPASPAAPAHLAIDANSTLVVNRTALKAMLDDTMRDTIKDALKQAMDERDAQGDQTSAGKLHTGTRRPLLAANDQKHHYGSIKEQHGTTNVASNVPTGPHSHGPGHDNKLA